VILEMTGARVERRLAAILAADIAGYSRLMGADEEGTLARLKACRKALVDPKIAEYRGRIVKTTGDGMLVEFGSAVDAVRCAVEVQRGMASSNVDIPEAKRIEFRIGIHVGDIIIDDNDIFGEGVNIAARLEGIADPGGICISDDAHRQIRGKTEIAYDDMGHQSLKNIAEPMRAWRARPAANATSSEVVVERPAPMLALPDKPSIVVLPFQNMSGDPEQDYFADGMVEDITTGLSRIKWLFVIARNSSFTYKGKAVDVRQVGRELGVRYVLEGGVRKTGNRVRITAQLVEAETGRHLWADRFDGALEDVFDLQDQITERVVGIVEPSLQRSEIERSRRKPPENLDAYDLYLRALPHMASVMPADAKIASRFLSRALELDPDYASAQAMLAWCHEICFMRGGFDEADRIAGLDRARASIASGTDDAASLAVAALVVSHLAKERETAASTIERALSLNPSSAMALYFGAHIYAFNGDPAAVSTHAKRALRLSPFDQFSYEAHNALGLAAIQEARYGEAASNFANAVQANTRFSTLYFFQAVALALGGRLEEAKKIVRRALELEPGFRNRFFLDIGLVPAIADKLVEGAHLLGLPD
jgi:adenylate cyclase